MVRPPTVEEKEPRNNQHPWLYLWAVLGVAALLIQAIIRLSEVSWEALVSGELTPLEYAICAVCVALNAYLDGYRGFQQKFVPRVLARAHHLALYPKRWPALLAPLYAMAFFHATRKARIAAWSITLLVIVAILVVRSLPQPWRGIVDAGVVVGLAWGLVSLTLGAISHLAGSAPTADPEIQSVTPHAPNALLS